MYHWRTICSVLLSCTQERPRKRARTNGSNLNGGSGEKSNNGGRNSGGRSENGQQGPSPASSGSSSRLGGNSSAGSGGAIIESMHHHGKGVYSGTFSGMHFKRRNKLSKKRGNVAN